MRWNGLWRRGSGQTSDDPDNGRLILRVTGIGRVLWALGHESWPARFRAGYWYIVRGYDSEVCQRCGRPVRVVFHAPDRVWELVTGHARSDPPFDRGEAMWGEDALLVEAAVEALFGQHPERGGPEREQAAYAVVQAVKAAMNERAVAGGNGEAAPGILCVPCVNELYAERAGDFLRWTCATDDAVMRG